MRKACRIPLTPPPPFRRSPSPSEIGEELGYVRFPPIQVLIDAARPHSSLFIFNNFPNSSGNGKMMVEFFSPAMTFNDDR